MRTLLSLLFLCILCVSSVPAAQLVSMEIEVREAWENRPHDFIVADAKEVELVLGKPNQVVLANASMVLTPTLEKSSTLRLTADFYFLLPNPQPSFRNIEMEKGESKEVLETKGKKGRTYGFYFKNWKVLEGEPECQEDPADSSLWIHDFSAHFDFYYIKNSLADFMWNYNKTFLENEFSRIRKTFGIYPLTKLQLYYHECFYPQSDWNRGLKFALFSPKKEIRLIYSPEEKNLFAPHVGQIMFLDRWGYAPLFLTSGLAGFSTFSHYFAKGFLKEGKILPLDSLLVSASYRRQDQEIAFYEAASWMRYLMDKYGQGQVEELYRRASDISLRQELENSFGRIDQLEDDWQKFLENYQPAVADLFFFAKTFTGLRNYRQALKLYLELEKIAPQSKSANLIANCYYCMGEYSQASAYFRRWVFQDSLQAERSYVLGNMYQLEGKGKEARGEYRRALRLDGNYNPALSALAQMEADAASWQGASDWLEKMNGKLLSPEENIQRLLLLYQTRQALKDPPEKLRKIEKQTVAVAQAFLESRPEEPIAYLLLARSYLAGDSLPPALDNLKTARVLEDRAYYLGQIYYYTGLVYHEMGDDKTARLYLKEALDTPSGAREKELAKKLLAEL